MEPLTSYIIYTNPRSGSWLLADGLESTRAAGRPREWFDDTTQENERQCCAMPSLSGAAYAAYLAHIKHVGTSANGVFGLKLLYSQFAQLPQKLSALPDFIGVAAESILTTMFANVKHLWLTRRDKVRQAISHYRACQTDQWWRIGDKRPPRRPGTVEEPCFDAETVAQFERQAILNDLAWQRYFQHAGLTPLILVYEDLAADYVGVLRHVLRWLGVPEAQTLTIAPPRLNKQADATTEEWVRRYLASGKRGNLAGGSPLTDAAALRKQGRQWCEQGRYEEAVACLRQALRLRPDSAPTYNNLAVALTRQGQLEEAIDVCRQALHLRPDYAEAYHNMGEAFGRQGKEVEARICYREALRLKPDLAAAHNSLGVVLAAQGDWSAACRCYREALRLQADFAAAHHNLAVVLEKQGEVRQACRHYQYALEGRQDTPAAYLRLGEERARQGRLAEAAASYRLAVRRQPEHAESWIRLGQVLFRQGIVEEAIGCFEAALRLRPEDVELLTLLGDALRRLGRLSEAELGYRRALRGQPNSAYLHNHLGITLLGQGRPADAESCFRDSLACQAEEAPAHNNLGMALEQQGRLREAIAVYRQSIALDPDCADTHKNLALVQLLCGDFAGGWPEYEWRWKCAQAGRRSLTQPLWDGCALEGRTILLSAEQGLGDTLQFIRYASLVRQRGGVVLAEVQPALLPLLRRCMGIDQLLPSGATLPDYDVQAPLLSLPGLMHTTLETVPAEVPYLSADPFLVEHWREELRVLDGFRIGIAWQGSCGYGGDRHRSIPLRHFMALSQLSGVRLVSLQKGEGREQLTSAVRDGSIVDLADRLDEASDAFMDTAAVMQHLDLVIASDSAIAHLAGALAVPVWVILPVARDWRWLLEREDSPWYPSMRLFRQKQWGDWDEVFRRVVQAVQVRVETQCCQGPAN